MHIEVSFWVVFFAVGLWYWGHSLDRAATEVAREEVLAGFVIGMLGWVMGIAAVWLVVKNLRLVP